jgi:hypothetical protein
VHLPDNTIQFVQINIHQRIQDALILICKKLKINYFDDMELVLNCQDQNYILERDEILTKIIVKGKKSLFKVFHNKLDVHLKKIYFADIDHEIQEFFENP